MCEPTLIASAVAQGAGIMMQQRAANRAENARSAALADYNTRNMGYENEARDATMETAGMFESDNFNSGTDAATSRLQALYDNATNAQAVPVNTSVGVPKLVADTNMMEAANAAAFGQDLNNKLADLNSFGDYLANTISPQMNDSAAVGQMMGNFMKGSQGVLQADLDAANRKANSPMAQMLQAGGQIGMNYGLKS